MNVKMKTAIKTLKKKMMMKTAIKTAMMKMKMKTAIKTVMMKMKMMKIFLNKNGAYLENLYKYSEK
jgi:hypothetical protein